MDMRTYWKHNVAENMQVVEYTAEQKAMFPNVCLFHLSSWNIICHSDLHLQARDSFFECGLFPSRASISMMAWGVIWDKICKKEGKQTISLNDLWLSMSVKMIDVGERKKTYLPGGHPGSQVAGLY